MKKLHRIPPAEGDGHQSGGGASSHEERPHTNQPADARNVSLGGLADQAFAGMAARAARLHCTLYALHDGGFMLTRQAWGMSRSFPDLRAVAAVLRMMEAN